MYNWYDGEVDVQRHKDAARAAAERYALDEAVQQQARRPVLGGWRESVGRTLSAWGRRSRKQAADPGSEEGGYTPAHR